MAYPETGCAIESLKSQPSNNCAEALLKKENGMSVSEQMLFCCDLLRSLTSLFCFFFLFLIFCLSVYDTQRYHLFAGCHDGTIALQEIPDVGDARHLFQEEVHLQQGVGMGRNCAETNIA